MGKLQVLFSLAIKGFMILLSGFLIYQFGRNVLGGSWHDGTLRDSVLIAIIGWMMWTTSRVSSLSGKFGQFEKSFMAMATDFKAMSSDFREFKNEVRYEFRSLKAEFGSLKEDFGSHSHKGGKAVF